eukprot:scaffold7060_cov73-Skeletonema_marinoi.AAC.1
MVTRSSLKVCLCFVSEDFHTMRRCALHFDAFAHHLKLLSGGGSWNSVVDGRREVKCNYSEHPPYLKYCNI